MPENPISLRVPLACPHCEVTGLVKLQQTIQGGRVLLEWSCTHCGREWLVRHKDEAPSTP